MRKEHTPQRDLLAQFQGRRVWWPVLFGGAVVLYLVYGEAADGDATLRSALQSVKWSYRTGLWLVAAGLLVVIKSAAYIWQLRILSGHSLSWRVCFQIVMLFEFFAAVTPTNVGGAAIAVYILRREGFSFGRSMAIILTIFLLALLYYLVTLPLCIYLIGYRPIFFPLRDFSFDLVGTSMVVTFWIAYGYLAIQALLLGASLFVWPATITRYTKRLMMTRWLKRVRRGGIKLAHDVKTASIELRDRSTQYWLQVWAATLIFWTVRFLMLNCLVAAFAPQPMWMAQHVLAFARHELLYMAMMAAPTPGSAGVAEISFRLLFQDLTPAGLTLALAIFWRVLSYYPYLLIGVPVMAQWLKRVHLDRAVTKLAGES